MKILHISTSDQGGAFIAAYRFHKELCKRNLNSQFLVLNKYDLNSDVLWYFSNKRSIYRKIKESLLFRYYKYKKSRLKRALGSEFGSFSLPNSPYDITATDAYAEADIIHLHWVAGFLDYTSFFKRNNKPVIWTLHDENIFSGLFHYVPERKAPKFIEEIDRRYKKEKLELITKHVSWFICPSNWISNRLKDAAGIKNASSVIKNGLELPNKEILIPSGSKENLILFFAQDISSYYKGFFYLSKALDMLNKEEYILSLIGDVGINGNSLLSNINVRSNSYIKDPVILSQLITACKFLVVPSVADNLPNVIIEALAHGLPVIGFKSGGIPDLVIDNFNGYLVERGDIEGLSMKIRHLLQNNSTCDFFSKNALEFSAKYLNIASLTDSYVEVYQSLIRTSNK